MTIRYEANPPKIQQDTDGRQAMGRFVDRIRVVSEWCDAIHITENVLGYRRVPPIAAGESVRDAVPGIPITVSMRVRDKTEREISEFVEGCIAAGFSGILILMGDPPRDGAPDSGQVPSRTIARLREQGADSRIDLYLSIPNRPDPSTLSRKVRSAPRGFMTQVVGDIRQVRDLAEGLRGFRVIPIMLFPSERNRRAAEFLGMGLAPRGAGFAGFGEFVREAHGITGDVLITSPGDFDGLVGFLRGRAPLT